MMCTTLSTSMLTIDYYVSALVCLQDSRPSLYTTLL